MYRIETKNGYSEYHYKGYVLSETYLSICRWVTTIQGNNIYFEILRDFKEWVNNRNNH